MDFDLLPDDHPVRARVRRWLAAHPEPSGRALAEAGFVAPHWPEPWGLGAGEPAKHRLGASGMLAPSEGPWHHGFLFAPALMVGGGTSEIQRNIVAERILGLPRDAPATG